MNKRTSTSRVVWLAALAALLLAAPAAVAADGGESGNGVVNVNTATLEELQLLPGIGEAKAKAIVATREQRGGFKSVNELVEVRGIGQTALEKLRGRAVVNGKTTARRP